MAFYVAYRGDIQGPVDETIVVSWIENRQIDQTSKIARGPNGPWKRIQSHQVFETALELNRVRPNHIYEPPPRPNFDGGDPTGFAVTVAPIVVCVLSLLSVYYGSDSGVLPLFILATTGSCIAIYYDAKKCNINLGMVFILNLCCCIGRFYYFALRQRVGGRYGLMSGFITETLACGFAVTTQELVGDYREQMERAEAFARVYGFGPMRPAPPYKHIELAELATRVGVFSASSFFFVLFYGLLMAYATKIVLKDSYFVTAARDTAMVLVRAAGWIFLGTPSHSAVHRAEDTLAIGVFVRAWLGALAFATCLILEQDVAAFVLGFLVIINLVAIRAHSEDSLRVACRSVPHGNTALQELFHANGRIYAKYALVPVVIVVGALAWRIFQTWTSNGKVIPIL